MGHSIKEHPENLNSWVLKRLLIPSLIAIIFIFIISSFQLFYTWKNKKEYSLTTINQASELISVALIQKNRVLLETILNALRFSISADSIDLCEANKLLVHSGKFSINACEPQSLWFFSPAIRDYALAGFESYHILIVIPFFGLHSELFFNLFLTGFLLIFSIWLAFSVRNRLTSDIFNPIKSGFLDGTALQIVELELMRKQLQNIVQLKLNAAIGEAMFLKSKQISHDIRSPLSVLNIMIGPVGNFPEDNRLVMRSAINRINDIANQLLKNDENIKIESMLDHKSQISEVHLQQFESKNETVELLPAIVDMMITEKRIQFREKLNLTIDTDFEESYGAFAQIDSLEFKRLLSNLINNSVEAIGQKNGRIVVAVKNYGTKKIVIVRDNGGGIPQYILAHLGELGVSYGKAGTESGSGLGVYHAKKTIELFGGKFIINSQQGLGTEIRMEFPACPIPTWFVANLNLAHYQKVVALDDDRSVLEVWQQRFASYPTHTLKLVAFTSNLEFCNWFENHKAILNETLFLMDYEILGQISSGLDLIEKYELNQNAILITSHYEDPNIRARCGKLNVRLIPKSLAGYVPFEIES